MCFFLGRKQGNTIIIKQYFLRTYYMLGAIGIRQFASAYSKMSYKLSRNQNHKLNSKSAKCQGQGKIQVLQGYSNLGKLCREVGQVEVTKPRNHLGMLMYKGQCRVAPFQSGLLKQSPEKQMLWKQPAPRRVPDRPGIQMRVPQPLGVLAWSHKQQLTVARKKLRKPHQTPGED